MRLKALVWLAFGVLAWSAVGATRPASAPAPETRAAIRVAVGELDHPRPERRRDAARRLAGWGPLALPDLQEAAAGPRLERALAARDLLAQLGEVFLFGGIVRLEADRREVAWDEPFDLILHVANPGEAPLRLPWSIDPDPPGGESEADAAQVAAVLSVADFLTVTGPDGQPVAPRVDPIDRDARVRETINVLASQSPPTGTIAPGASARLVLRAFNRGWARYPMLSAGIYSIAFACQPEWNDARWTAQGLGRVEAPPLRVHVRSDAPEAVRMSDRPMAAVLRREGDSLVAELVNTWDRPQWVSLNLGGPPETHAAVEWRLPSVDHDRLDAVNLETGADEPLVRPERFRPLEPGQALEVVRVPVAAIQARLRDLGIPSAQAHAIAFSYRHLPSAEALRLQLKAAGRRVAVPRHLFSGTVTSEPVPLEAEASQPVPSDRP